MVCVRYMKQISNGHKLYTLRYPINSSTSVLLFQHDTFLMYRGIIDNIMGISLKPVQCLASIYKLYKLLYVKCSFFFMNAYCFTYCPKYWNYSAIFFS